VRATWLVGQNVLVPDVSIYVALITAGAGVTGAAISQVASVARDVRLAERDRQERRTDARTRAYLDLLGAAGDLRTLVGNATLYRGDQMGAQLAGIGSSAAAVQLCAVRVGLLARQALADAAAGLAVASRELATAVVQNTDLKLNQLVVSPDCTEFDGRVEAFRLRAVEDADERPTRRPRAGRRVAALPRADAGPATGRWH
jgi:hypothetical protein